MTCDEIQGVGVSLERSGSTLEIIEQVSTPSAVGLTRLRISCAPMPSTKFYRVRVSCMRWLGASACRDIYPSSPSICRFFCSNSAGVRIPSSINALNSRISSATDTSGTVGTAESAVTSGEAVQDSM